MKYSQNAFSLVEILVGILIVSIVIVAAFSALWSIWIARVKLTQQVDIEKQAYYLAERFFETIKKWWTLDYEEYWNRSSYDTTFASWSYTQQSGFWNFWDGWSVGSVAIPLDYGDSFYYCISPDGWLMGTGWCLAANNTTGDNTSQSQRYLQYEEQFIDYNSDWDGDGGDEDGDWNPLWDDDDLFLGQWPEAFSSSNRVWELYLISSDKKERTFFRWNVENDPNAPSSASCNGTQNMTGSGCLGTIEFLKLIWEDRWYDHSSSWSWSNDGVIDTWLIHPDFTWWSEVIAWSNTNKYWQPLFPESVSVMDVRFYAYPNKDANLAWRENIGTSPYIQVQMTLMPSWQQRKKIRGKTPQVDFTTTISLSDLDLR